MKLCTSPLIIYEYFYVFQANIQENHQKQVNRTILWIALHICPFELLDMSLVCHACSEDWYYIGGYS